MKMQYKSNEITIEYQCFYHPKALSYNFNKNETEILLYETILSQIRIFLFKRRCFSINLS